jgi:enoyl-CoA hydratase
MGNPDDGKRPQPRVVVEDLDDHVCTLRLNRPEKLNALDRQTALDLRRSLLGTRARVVVLAGSARAFSVGADLREGFADGGASPWLETLDALAGLPIPVIAAVEGHCLGGGLELALCCDLRIAGAGATFAVPEVKRGLFPSAGGTQRLPRLVGASRAKQLLFTGDAVDAATAERWGLVNEVVPEGQAERRAAELARTLAAGAPLALRAVKRLVDESAELPLDAGLALEQERIGPVVASEDVGEGVRAFFERRPPAFRGR